MTSTATDSRRSTIRLTVFLLAVLSATIPGFDARGQVTQRVQRVIQRIVPAGTVTILSTNAPAGIPSQAVLEAIGIQPGDSPFPVPMGVVTGMATNATALPKSPEDKKLQELLKLKFDRSATTILTTLAAQFDGKSATNEVEQFRQSVVVGDWPAAGKFLGGLPKDHGTQVYRYLLKELANPTKAAGPVPMPMPEQPEILVQQNQQGPATFAGPTLVVGDVLILAEQAPHELADEDAKLLGQLLGKLLNRGDALEPLLPKLEQGVKALGGSNPADRHRAAEMLVAANRLIEAGSFFAPLESAKGEQDWKALDLHARQLFALGKKEKDSKLLMQAWEVNQFILASTNAATSNREPALRRCFDLMPLISRDVGTNWLRKSFQGDPAQGLVILSAVNQQVQRGLSDRSTDQRQKNLELQKQVVETFLDVSDPAQPHWRAALNLLAEGWMQEGTYARQRYQPRRNYGQQFDQFGNMIGYEQFPQQNYDGNQMPPLPVDRAAKNAPGDAWLAQLDESLRLATLALIADLQIKADAADKALPCIEAIAAKQPRAATDLANDFLRAWARTRNPVQNQPHQQSYMSGGAVYYTSSPGMRAPGISLTRAMQARNIRELSGILKKLEALKLPKLDDDALVGAFSSAHSPAEVFHVEDIEAVFGQIDRIKLETLAGLAQTMRERLASQWLQARVQQEAKTQRTDKQIDAEVLRGYEAVLKLIEDGLKREPDQWQLNLARAAAYFDLAEFQYGKKVDLEIYVAKRDEAFKGFARAAALYATALPQIEEKDQSPKVYQQWFNANLGASDLAYVTRQQEPETNQLQRIRTAILALPGGAAERHLSTLAKSLGQSANSLRPELKPRYLRAGLKVVGDHPDAEDARKLVAYYNDLLQEIEFIARLDGDAAVGHGRPFGVFVSLRHTADLEREAGGFGRYLRNLKKSTYMYAYNPYGQQQQRNFVEDFDQQVREKLVDRFDIKAITFLDDKVKSRGYGRAGWRETPLAFLLLQAKDGSVDQLPALRMDLDFTDQRGQVVLPVESQITLIDARPERVEARPVTSLEVTQILDDRDIAQGKLTLEMKASGKGIVPELSALLRTNFAGLNIEEITDQGVAVSQIDTEGDELAPVTERNWLFKLRVAEDAPASLAFHFPEAVPQSRMKMTYKRYADADLVEVQPSVALAGLSLHPRPWWHWLALGVVALAAIGGGIWWLRRHKPQAAQERPTYILPEPATAFAVISLLRRMEADQSLGWADSDHAELGKSIRSLEAYFFSRERNGDPEPDLVGVGRRWVALAGNGK